MSTKNLARTLIEGGRSHYNQYERRQSHANERAHVRQYLARVRELEDSYELALPKRPSVPRDFSDKLGAPRRWLRSHAGKPWNDVRAEMFERFNPQTLAGQHIIYDHLLAEVQMWGEAPERWRRARFFVDERGVLRDLPRKRRSRTPRGKWPSDAELAAWFAGRRVGPRGELLYWFEQAFYDEKRKCAYYRQSHALTAAERAYWLALDERCRQHYEFQP